MSQSIPDKYRDLFTKRAFASLATLMPDGSPQVTPVWVDSGGRSGNGEHRPWSPEGQKHAT